MINNNGTFCTTTLVRGKKCGENDVTSDHVTGVTSGHVTNVIPSHLTDVTSGHVTDVTSGHLTDVTSGHVTSVHVTSGDVLSGDVTSGSTPFPKFRSTDQTPNMRLPSYSQSNDEEPYYILKTNNPFFFVLGTSIL